MRCVPCIDSRIARETFARRIVHTIERLVEQQSLGIGHQRAGKRHAARLAAGELPRVTRRKASQRHFLQSLHRAPSPLGSCHSAQGQRALDVLQHGPGKHRRILWQERDTAPGAEFRRIRIADAHAPDLRYFQTRQQREQRRLAGAIGADDADRLARFRGEGGDPENGAGSAPHLETLDRKSGAHARAFGCNATAPPFTTSAIAKSSDASPTARSNCPILAA